MGTAAPVLSYFTMNYMRVGYIDAPSTQKGNGDVIREEDEQSA
jgi:hypothetical protein